MSRSQLRPRSETHPRSESRPRRPHGRPSRASRSARDIPVSAPISRRVRVPVATDPDHHLWRNGRLWWVAFTVLEDGWRQRRVRLSLQTDDVTVARHRRDQLFSLVDKAERCRVSLRFGGRKRRPRRSELDTLAPGRAAS